MSHKPDVEGIPAQDPTSSEWSSASHPFLLVECSMLESVEVELVDHPVILEEPQFEDLLADGQCEV